MAQLRTKLHNGDIVEVVTQNGHTPSRDWLTFAKSSRARNKIKHWLNEHQRERAMEIGKKLLDREARKYKVSLGKLTDTDYARAAAECGLATASDLMAAIGFGKYSSRQVLNKLSPGATSQSGLDVEPGKEVVPGTMSEAVRRVHMHGSDSLQVEGQDDLLVYRARCCNPIRGEEIVGYVTRGKGVAVHARSCPNVQNLLYESDRRIAVEWARAADEKPGRKLTYPVKLTVFCDDRAGMLKEMTAVISDDGTNIRGVDSKSKDDSEAVVEFVLEAEDMRHLTRIVSGLRRVPGVRDLQRAHKV
jgi:GTP pyrophosphokinase